MCRYRWLVPAQEEVLVEAEEQLIMSLISEEKLAEVHIERFFKEVEDNGKNIKN